MISHLHLINTVCPVNKQLTNFVFLDHFHWCRYFVIVVLNYNKRREWSSICILLWKRTVFASFKPTFWNPYSWMWIELSTFLQPGYEQYCLRRTRDWGNRMMSLQTRGTAMLFLIFFSCHVINGPDYSNEHMNLKTTSQKWCIYISNEINRRERERSSL